jgi:hypothetical protein
MSEERTHVRGMRSSAQKFSLRHSNNLLPAADES